MSDFGTSAMLEVELDQRSVRKAKQNLEAEFSDVAEVSVDGSSFGSPNTRPGSDRSSGFTTGETFNPDGGRNLQAAQLEKQQDIHEELEKIGVSGGLGGGGGGGGLGIPEWLAGGLTLKAGSKLAPLAAAFASGAGAVTLGSLTLAAGSVYLTAEHPPNSPYTPGPGDPTETTDVSTDTRADMLNISEDRLMSERLVEQKQEQLLNTPQSDLGTGRTVTERIKANPGSTKLVGMNWQTMMATVSVRGSTMQIPYETLPGNLKNKAIQGNFAGGGGGGGESGDSTGGGTTPAGAPSPARQDQEVRQALVGAVKETLGDQTMNIDIYNEYTIDPSGTRLIEEEFEKKANEAKKEAVNEIKEIMGADTTGSPQRYGPG